MYIDKQLKHGYNVYIDMAQDDMGTQLDVGVLVLEAGERFEVDEPDKEVAALLLEGEITFEYCGKTAEAARKDMFNCDPWCLHVGKGTPFAIATKAHCEVYIQKSLNDRPFEAKLYAPEDTIVQHAGANGELLGSMRREIKTLFDYDNAPYSNMVLGEVLNFPGKWSSYPPHHHPQPEVYFHRFDKPQGFGASFANGEVYISKNNGLTIINDGFHSQAAAPGYAMCYLWGIRHLDGDPWKKTRIDDKEHEWLWKPDANDHIFQPCK